jgi:hypothetical protein
VLANCASKVKNLAAYHVIPMHAFRPYIVQTGETFTSLLHLTSFIALKFYNSMMTIT